MRKYFQKGNALWGFANFGKDDEHGNPGGIRPVWPRILLLALALGVAGWTVFALAAFLFMKHTRDIESGRFADFLLLPVRWENYQVAWGEDYIERGREYLEAGKPDIAFHYLRAGVRRAPENLEARRTLALFYRYENRRDQAIRILYEGLRYGFDDHDYLETVFKILLEDGEEELILQFADEYLPPEPVGEAQYELIASAAARAALHRGDFKRTETLIEGYGFDSVPGGTILLARLAWMRGEHDVAIEQLEAIVRDHPGRNDAYRYLIDYLYEMERSDEAERHALARYWNDPLSPGPRLGLLRLYIRQQDLFRVNEEIEALLEDFPGDTDVLDQLSRFAREIKHVELARRIFEHCQDRGMNLIQSGKSLVQTLMLAGNYRESLALAERLAWEEPRFRAGFQFEMEALKAVENYSRGDLGTGHLHLNQFLAAHRGNPDVSLLYSDKLLELGLEEQARRVLTHALRAEPESRAVLGALVRLDIGREDVPSVVEHLAALLELGLPPTRILGEAYAFLGSDRFLFVRGRGEILEEIESVLARQPSAGFG